jgi:hypothetical protein
MHMRHPGLSLENPGALELDVLRIAFVEQTAPSTKVHRDEVDLEFVEDAGGECEADSGGAVGEQVAKRPSQPISCASPMRSPPGPRI